ncbi:glutamate--cysteine ligase [Candidatus Venteria ishoeyi]|uniref:glutamate--cysteine ligase n=1 Tax=Candidatus Venteria ishoeyi TaxID=1899563 RepID=UPI0025A5428E|nr:glutamate--cysteine ligase [Candidatus Venteria ishoeyi]MDM8545481.1 glutamate--cysteine ligase [Candidatus Venteria ishoeyi]
MYSRAEQRLQALSDNQLQHLLQNSQIGLEKESLRVARRGSIAQTPHPKALGSALSNPWITTDYSEALLELITPPFESLRESLEFLCATHQFVYQNLDEEILWATSMPCILAGSGDEGIPLAYYGESNPGVMKTVYRRGLGYRYGRIMQVIAGVHFNYSFSPDFWAAYQTLEGDQQPLQSFIDQHYFGLLRNLQRFGWLIPYLFGASPAVCTSFLQDQRPRSLQPFDDSTYYSPRATSLRMGDIGYQNNKEVDSGVKACYNDLQRYTDSLMTATRTPCPEYEKIGVQVAGVYRQLNANQLQIENEYYSTVRAKQITQDMETPSLALRRRGVRYIELRSLDVNAYDPLGINETQLRFLEALILFCLLHESPDLSCEEIEEIDSNQTQAAHYGRDPSLLLRRKGKTRLLRTWATELCCAMQGVCEILDYGTGKTAYMDALEEQQEVVHNSELTPSQRMLTEMRDTREGFYEFTRRLSQQHLNYFMNLPKNPEKQAFFQKAAQDSLLRQQTIEAEDSSSYSDYLAQYFSQN